MNCDNFRNDHKKLENFFETRRKMNIYQSVPNPTEYRFIAFANNTRFRSSDTRQQLATLPQSNVWLKHLTNLPD